MSAKLTIQEVRRYGEAWGLELLSKEYVNRRSPLLWACASGHQFWRPMKKTKKIQTCPGCATSLERAKFKIKARGGAVVENTGQERSKEKITIQCSRGHIWKTTPAAINQNYWCAVCAGKNLIPQREILEIVQSRGGQIVEADSFHGGETRMILKCKFGHFWVTRAKNIKIGRWCHKCRESTKGWPAYKINQKNIKYKKKYNKLLEVQKKRREYRQRPEVKEYMKEYKQRPEVKKRARESTKKYEQSPGVKERHNQLRRDRRARKKAEKAAQGQQQGQE